MQILKQEIEAVEGGLIKLINLQPVKFPRYLSLYPSLTDRVLLGSYLIKKELVLLKKT
jgi:hypothetical protein